MRHPALTVTFKQAVDPITTRAQLAHILEHLDCAGFAVGLEVESAEIAGLAFEERRAADR